ncbi:ATP-binding cassette domain-containing protein [Radiobacillus sp. PE A8.2]|uniref:ATP-binding cassette domain-containing protein n=1 Tax=Radiobacillus sp. PE A8.2 TaxID=3380349 RepID=UPI00388FF644
MQGVSKKFIRFAALSSCNITIGQGKVVGIVGENGSGKSTLLRLLSGLLKPTRGKITVGGQPVTRQIRKVLAYATDQDYFYPYLTIQQLVDYYASQFPDFDREKAKAIMHFMNLDSSSKISHLSKGNRGRVKIMVTLSRNAPYLVLDEPFSGLDPMVRESIIKGMIQFVDLEQQTVILTTHEIKDIEPLLDEVILLKQGRVIAQAPVEEIRERYKMNVIDWMQYYYQHTQI